MASIQVSVEETSAKIALRTQNSHMLVARTFLLGGSLLEWWHSILSSMQLSSGAMETEGIRVSLWRDKWAFKYDHTPNNPRSHCCHSSHSHRSHLSDYDVGNTTKLNDIHVSLNSRLSELVAASITQGRQVERDNTAGVISSLAAAIVKK